MIISPPEFHIGLTLGILLLAVVFYAQERVPMVLVSLGLLVGLIVVFQIYPYVDPDSGANLLSAPALLYGFSHPALVIVVALLVIGEGVTITGSVSMVASWIQQLSMGNWRLALAISLFCVALASAFLNNTPIVVIFLPILVSMADELKLSSSKFLMQLSFVSILGGTCTLMGTSTNILVASFADQAGVGQFEMFTFSILGGIVLLVGLLYLVFIAPSLLPASAPIGTNETHRQFVVQLAVISGTLLDGKRLSDDDVKQLFDQIEVNRILRDGKVLLPENEDFILMAGDSLLLTGSARDLKKLEWDSGSSLLPPSVAVKSAEEQKLQDMAELVVMPGTSLVGRTLSQIRFQNRYGIAVIGIQQHRHIRVRNLGNISLRAGDVLLVQGTSGQLNCLSDRRDMILLWGVKDTVEHSVKAKTSAFILFGVVLLAATRLVDILVISLVGAFLMLATRCLTMRQTYGAISPQIVFMVAATLALGKAMEITGSVEYIANGMIQASLGLSIEWILALFIFIVMLLTNIISNTASAVLFAPIAIGVAEQLSVSPMPFLVGVIFGANAAFATPIGYQTNLMVLSAGYYRLRDFVRVGLPLNIIVWMLVSYLIPKFWPFL
ncbi:MAG: SLC13 family permease [Magnetococcales bacterium]|nr:SLC13 family permease [Magnetococcales bacterium]